MCAHIRLVGVALFVHALLGLLALVRWIILAELCKAVGLCAGEQSILGSLDVALLTTPCLQHRVLKRSGIGEGHVPGVGALVHGVQVEGCLQLRLATRQEADAGHSGGDTAAEQPVIVGGEGNCV